MITRCGMHACLCTSAKLSFMLYGGHLSSIWTQREESRLECTVMSGGEGRWDRKCRPFSSRGLYTVGKKINYKPILQLFLYQVILTGIRFLGIKLMITVEDEISQAIKKSKKSFQKARADSRLTFVPLSEEKNNWRINRGGCEAADCFCGVVRERSELRTWPINTVSLLHSFVRLVLSSLHSKSFTVRPGQMWYDMTWHEDVTK